MKKPTCPYDGCKAKPRDGRALARHLETYHSGTTPGGLQNGDPQRRPTSGDPFAGDPETPNEVNEISRVSAPENGGVSALLSSVVSERTSGDPAETLETRPFPGATVVDDPAALDRETVGYLMARRDYLDPRELRFVLGMNYKVKSKENHISDLQREWLHQIRSIVEGLEEEERRDAERARRDTHDLMVRMKDPRHVREGCALCDAEDKYRAEAKLIQEQCRREQDEILEQTRLRKEREGLQASRIDDRRTPRVSERIKYPRWKIAPKAATPGAKNEGLTDAS